MKLGFIVNPIAGMGGKVGLKGTDGKYEDAKKLGAETESPKRAVEMLNSLRKRDGYMWVTCSGIMGKDELDSANFNNYEVIYNCTEPTTAQDTKNAAKVMMERNVNLIVFCGGDGTARDILSVVGKNVPILGIPSGVKMHSAVFAVSPQKCGEIVEAFINNELRCDEAEVMDLDEERYRMGEWNIKVYGYALTPYEPTYIQSGKMVIEEREEQVKIDMANYIIEDMEDDILYILGPGGTLFTLKEELGIEGTLLGVDAVVNKKMVSKDTNEKELLSLLNTYKRGKIIVSPIGAQGFIFGRGNLQISAQVIKKVGMDNIIVLCTPSKLNVTPVLRVDTGDEEVDKKFREKGVIWVTVGAYSKRLVNIE